MRAREMKPLLILTGEGATPEQVKDATFGEIITQAPHYFEDN